MFIVKKVEPDPLLPHCDHIVLDTLTNAKICVVMGRDSTPLGLKKEDAEQLCAWLNEMINVTEVNADKALN